MLPLCRSVPTKREYDLLGIFQKNASAYPRFYNFVGIIKFFISLYPHQAKKAGKWSDFMESMGTGAHFLSIYPLSIFADSLTYLQTHCCYLQTHFQNRTFSK